MKNLTTMENLRNALISENGKQFNDTKNIIIEKISNKDIDWWISEYLTDLRIKQLKKNELSDDKAIEITTKKAIKKYSNDIDKELLKIDLIESSNDLKIDDRLVLHIDWNKSRTWGYCPKCELLDNKNVFYSDRISGCGYDKESTAIAEVLNQYNPILKRLYQLKNDNIKMSNHELFGYGSGYGIKPHFEGGVGVSSYYKIFEKIGMKLQKISSGDKYDIYEIIVIK